MSARRSPRTISSVWVRLARWHSGFPSREKVAKLSNFAVTFGDDAVFLAVLRIRWQNLIFVGCALLTRSPVCAGLLFSTKVVLLTSLLMIALSGIDYVQFRFNGLTQIELVYTTLQAYFNFSHNIMKPLHLLKNMFYYWSLVPLWISRLGFSLRYT